MKISKRVVAKALAHTGCAIPLAGIARDTLTNQLGTDPAETLVRLLGFWGITLLWITLAMTPLRHLTGGSLWIACRRLLGLWCFAYISLHLLAFLVFWCGANLEFIIEETVKRPYVALGLIGWILLVPLAITSTQKARRALGKRWIKLHQLIYPIALLGLVHLIWIEKLDYTKSIIFSIILIFLFFIRFRARQRKPASIECASSA